MRTGTIAISITLFVRLLWEGGSKAADVLQVTLAFYYSPHRPIDRFLTAMPSLRFLARHFWPFSVPVPDADLSGVSAIVTGATSGLGYATAEYLVKHGVSTLVLGCRNLEKGAEVKEKLLEFAPHKDQCQIHVWKLDLASFDSVIAFHKQVQQLEDVHIFISNAGIAPSKDWKFSEDGWEES